MSASKLFWATVITFAIAWVICAVSVWLMPAAMATLTGQMVHLDLQGLEWSMTITGLVVGLLAWSLMAGAIAWLIASIYNRLAV